MKINYKALRLCFIPTLMLFIGMLKVLIHQMVESKIELQEIVFNDNYFKHDNFTCILRWS